MLVKVLVRVRVMRDRKDHHQIISKYIYFLQIQKNHKHKRPIIGDKRQKEVGSGKWKFSLKSGLLSTFEHVAARFSAPKGQN